MFTHVKIININEKISRRLSIYQIMGGPGAPEEKISDPQIKFQYLKFQNPVLEGGGILKHFFKTPL